MDRSLDHPLMPRAKYRLRGGPSRLPLALDHAVAVIPMAAKGGYRALHRTLALRQERRRNNRLKNPPS